MEYLFSAIKSLKPNAEFGYTEQDYSTIVWTKLEGDAPTQAEIDAAIQKIKADEIKAAEQAIADKAAAAAKLEALGLTAGDLKALGL